MISRLIQRIVHTIFSLKFDFNLKEALLPEHYGVDASFESNSQKTELPRNISNGVTNAAYGNRFAIIPFEYFTAIILNKNPDDVSTEDLKKLSAENNLTQKRRNISGFVDEFEVWHTRFLQAFTSQNSITNEALSVFREEIFHNKHLSDTTTWTASQALTVCYRLSSAYLTHYRYKLDTEFTRNKAHLQMTQFLLNVYFIRQVIAKYTTPIVEAYFHYNDANLKEVDDVYGSTVYYLCNDYRKLRFLLDKKFPNETDNILEFVSKIVMNYPFAYQLTRHTGLDYVKFQEYYKMIPIRRFEQARDLILNGTYETSVELLKKISQLFNQPSKLENKFSSSIVYYGTKGIIPSQLIYFIIKQVFITNYRKVVLHYVKDFLTGSKHFDNSYAHMPALRSFGLDDQCFNVDPGMKLFKGEAIVIAQNSFEPTIAGDDGFTDIVNSEICTSLMVQTIFLKALYLVCELDWKLEEYIEDYALSFRARPYIESHRREIEIDILPTFFAKASPFRLYYRTRVNIVNPLDASFARKFEITIKELVNFVKSKDKETQLKFFSFCELNYSHGF